MFATLVDESCCSRPTQDQLLIDWTSTINDLASPTAQATTPDSVSLTDTAGSVDGLEICNTYFIKNDLLFCSH
jgi:hypothetical protein